VDEQQFISSSPYRLAWRGRVLKFGPVSQRVKATCVAACKQTAIVENDELLNLKFGKEEAKVARAAQEKEFYDLVRTGAYAWGGTRFIEWRQNNRDNERVLIGALLEQGGTPLTDDEINLLRKEKRGEILTLYMLCLLDDEIPNAERPAGTNELLAEMEKEAKRIESQPRPSIRGGTSSPSSGATLASQTAN
jgi:hypothetical protein